MSSRGESTPIGQYLESNGFQDDSDTIWMVLSKLLAQDGPITKEQAEAVSCAGKSLARGVAACNAREDLLHSRDIGDIFRFVGHAGKLTPPTTCEKAISLVNKPIELRFLAEYFKAQGLPDAAREAIAKAEAETVRAPDLSKFAEGSTPTRHEVIEALGELAECTRGLCGVYGRRGWPLALANKVAEG